MNVLLRLITVSAALTALLPTASVTAAELHGQWSMTATENTVPGAHGTGAMTLYGQWVSAPGAVGRAVKFPGAVGFGVARGSEGDNPLWADFAMGVTFTSKPIPTRGGWSGNVMQKGLADEQGQVKISLQPAHGGTTFCRIKGSKGYRVLKSRVNIDDGSFHTAVCWRRGGTIGLTVDGTATKMLFDAGSVATRRPVRVGNKSAAAGYADQHLGRNDCSVWLTGTGARRRALTQLPC